MLASGEVGVCRCRVNEGDCTLAQNQVVHFSGLRLRSMPSVSPSVMDCYSSGSLRRGRVVMDRTCP
jgi:hypothetical protein